MKTSKKYNKKHKPMCYIWSEQLRKNTFIIISLSRKSKKLIHQLKYTTLDKPKSSLYEH